MGFLSGIMGGSKTSVPASGFYSQPKGYQDLYNSILTNANAALPNLGAGTFTPMPQTADETRALEMMRKGFAPTAESLSADVGMLMNPFDQYVIDEINRQAGGDFSILKQNATQAGQFGSNRQQLGANDIEQTRLGTIGKLRQGQYNQALGQIFQNLIPQRQNDTNALLGIGEFQRNLDERNRLAPLQAVQAQQGMLGGFPTSFGDFGSQARTIKTGGGLGGLLGGIGQIGGLFSGAGGLASAAGFGSTGSALSGIGSALGMFSDIRLKQDIIPLGQENGHNIYEFSYNWEPEKRYIGVMAQEVLQTNPSAVSICDGFMCVDYSAIGVQMREVA